MTAALPRPLPPPRSRATGGSARLLRRGVASGWAALSDAELLGLVAGSTAERGRDLLESAGGLLELAVLDALSDAQLGGLRPAQVRRVAWAVELGRRVAAARAEPGWRIRSPADVGERLMPVMRTLEREELRTLLLNTKNVVLTDV